MRTDFRPVSPQRPPRLTIQGIRSYVNDPSNISVEIKSLFARSGYGVLRLLAREGDIRLLSDYLKIAPVEPDLCRRFLTEENPSDLNIRILLMKASGKWETEATPSDNTFPTDPASAHRHICRALAQKDSFLRLPLMSMGFHMTRRVTDHGTDGISFFLHPDRESPLTPEEIHHMCIHCMFGHRAIPSDAEPLLWNTSADLAAEYLRVRLFPEDEHTGSPRTIDSLAPVISRFPRSVYPGSITSVYRQLRELLTEDELLALHLQLRHDDHSIWRSREEDLIPEGEGTEGASFSDPRSEKVMKQLWEDALSQVRRRTAGSRRGIAPGSREERILLQEESRHDYRSYLRRFAEIREEVQLDMESFDYIPYDYGLRMYGNMPLIEPLEYTEAFKIEQLAIAIDTSGSCDTVTVQNFLTDVHRILTAHDNFFRRMEVHIFQCDSVIHEHRIIHSTEEWTEYVRDIRIQGRGGTDFTPVFDQLRKMQDAGQCRRLRGLLYFTDGDGIYPRDIPPYETAFIFSRKDYMQFQPPAWCVKLCTDDTSERYYYEHSGSKR